MTSAVEERSDPALMALAQKCDGGVPQILDHFFGFLARRTNFFDDKSFDQCQRKVEGAFDRQCAKMDEMMRQRRMFREQQERREAKLARQQRELEKQRKEAEKAATEGKDIVDGAEPKPEVNEAGVLMPNEGNGCDLPNYKWTQTLDKIELTVPFTTDFVLKSRYVIVDFQKKHLKVGLRGFEAVIDGDLFAEIELSDYTTWTLDQDKKIVTIQLIKKKGSQFWPKLVSTDPAIKICN